jgi:hypothetical protein
MASYNATKANGQLGNFWNGELTVQWNTGGDLLLRAELFGGARPE